MGAVGVWTWCVLETGIQCCWQHETHLEIVLNEPGRVVPAAGHELPEDSFQDNKEIPLVTLLQVDLEGMECLPLA